MSISSTTDAAGTIHINSSSGTGTGYLPSAYVLGKAHKLRDQGYALQIQGLQESATDVMANAANNVRVLQQNTNGQLEQQARDFSSLSSSQRAAAGSSGLSAFSGSFLNVYAQTADNFTRDMSRLQSVTTAQERSVLETSTRQAEAYTNSIASVQIQQQADNLTYLYRLP